MNIRQRDCLLIFRLGSIGDTVVALPCFHAIAREYPGYRRVLLTNSVTSVRATSAESILEGSGLIEEVIHYPVGDFSFKSGIALVRELKRVHPARMIYLAERKTAAPVFRDLLFFKAAGVPKIVGYPWSRELRNCKVDPHTLELEFEAERLARTLRSVVQVNLGWPSWDLRLSALELARAESLLSVSAGTHEFLAVAPGAKMAAKDWGVDNWGALLKLLARPFNHVALVIVGASDERALGDDVARHWTGPILNLCGHLTPRETAAVLLSCRLLVCHDSGPMHLAAAQRIPCVALFGNNNRPRQWYPFGTGHCVIHEPRGIREISVERVADAIRLALEARTDAIGEAIGIFD